MFIPPTLSWIVCLDNRGPEWRQNQFNWVFRNCFNSSLLFSRFGRVWRRKSDGKYTTSCWLLCRRSNHRCPQGSAPCSHDNSGARPLFAFSLSKHSLSSTTVRVQHCIDEYHCMSLTLMMKWTHRRHVINLTQHPPVDRPAVKKSMHASRRAEPQTGHGAWRGWWCAVVMHVWKCQSKPGCEPSAMMCCVSLTSSVSGLKLLPLPLILLVLHSVQLTVLQHYSWLGQEVNRSHVLVMMLIVMIMTNRKACNFKCVHCLFRTLWNHYGLMQPRETLQNYKS